METIEAATFSSTKIPISAAITRAWRTSWPATGAFLVAARSGFPVLPVVIRGSRQALPPGTFLLNPGRIEIEVTMPIAAPASTDEADTSAVRRAARQAILAKTNEPDLAPDEQA